MGCLDNKFLSPVVIEHLQLRGLCTLNKIVKENDTTIWSQRWLSAREVGIDIFMLKHGLDL